MNASIRTHHRGFGHSAIIGVVAAVVLMLLWAPVVNDLAPGAVAAGLITSSPSWSTMAVVGLAIAGLHALATRTRRHRHRRSMTSDV